MISEKMSTRAAAMSDQELYSFFTDNLFYNDLEFAKAVCQEVENREAAISGRKPAKISFSKLAEGRMGYSAGGSIVFSDVFLHRDVKRTPADLLNVILHEGRHEWQNHIHMNTDINSFGKDDWVYEINRMCYTSGNKNVIDIDLPSDVQGRIEYAMQENEIDARFYAIRRMQEIASLYDMDDSFLEAIDKAVDAEILDIGLVAKYMTEERYLILEDRKIASFVSIIKESIDDISRLPEGIKSYETIWIIKHIVIPAYEHVLEKAEKDNLNIMEKQQILYRLYETARLRKMEGSSLEKPEDIEYAIYMEGLSNLGKMRLDPVRTIKESIRI